jgi:hypothetical protein
MLDAFIVLGEWSFLERKNKGIILWWELELNGKII